MSDGKYNQRYVLSRNLKFFDSLCPISCEERNFAKFWEWKWIWLEIADYVLSQPKHIHRMKSLNWMEGLHTDPHESSFFYSDVDSFKLNSNSLAKLSNSYGSLYNIMMMPSLYNIMVYHDGIYYWWANASKTRQFNSDQFQSNGKKKLNFLRSKLYDMMVFCLFHPQQQSLIHGTIENTNVYFLN